MEVAHLERKVSYFLRMAYGEELSERKEFWKPISYEMIEMESDILKCSKNCVLCVYMSLGFWKKRFIKKNWQNYNLTEYISQLYIWM